MQFEHVVLRQTLQKQASVSQEKKKSACMLHMYDVKSQDKFSILIDDRTALNKTGFTFYSDISLHKQACNFLQIATWEGLCTATVSQ